MAESKIVPIHDKDGVLVFAQDEAGVVEIVVKVDKVRLIQAAMPLLLQKAAQADLPKPEKKPKASDPKPEGEKKPGKEKDRVPGNIPGQAPFPFGANADSEKKPEGATA